MSITKTTLIQALKTGQPGGGAITDDASGNVGIGRTPYASAGYRTLSVQGTNGAVVEVMDSAGTLFGRFYSQPTDKVVLQNSRVTGKIHFAIAAADAMWIDASRNVFVGTSHLAPGYFDNSQTGTTIRADGRIFSNGPDFHHLGRNSNGTVLAFANASAWRGSIDVSGTGTAYVTTSDARLKENVAPLSGAIDRLAQLNPVRFNFKGDDQTVDGFLAHEAQAVVPEAVTGEPDGTDFGGNPVYQGMDAAKLVPLLTAAIQELTARVAALEGNP